MRSTLQSAARSGRLRLACASVTWPCLLLLSVGCATPAPTRPIDPPPPALAAACVAGPAYPAGDMLLGELVEVVAAREAAAADCRARHAALLSAWPR